MGKNTEEYITFSVPIQNKVTSIDKNEEEIKETIYRLQFTDSTKLMASSSFSLVKNLAEGIHKIRRKYKHHDKKCETW